MASNDITEEKVKRFIRSILTSNPRVSTMQTLQRDYHESIGYPIPYSKFHYNSIEHFLRSIPDVCVVKGNGPFATVHPIVSEKIAHINEMVNKQKVNNKSGRRFIPPRRSHLRSFPGSNEPVFRPRNPNQSYDSQMHVRHVKHNEVKERVPEPVNECRVTSTSSNVPVPDSCSKKLDSTIRQINDDMLTKCHERLRNLITTELESDAQSNCVSVPKDVQANLQTLIGCYVNGIWANDLPKLYRERFNKQLCFMEYGYVNLIDMCVALKHIFHYVRPGQDDFKLYDRSKPLPSNIEKKFTIASYDKMVPSSQALPELDYSDFDCHIPEESFKLGKIIPRQFLPEGATIGDIFDAVVYEVYDPSKFWIMLGTSNVSSPLDRLMNDLQEFYGDTNNSKEFAVPPGAVKEGLYCVQVVYGEYHRAQVVRVLSDNKEYVRVFYIDYGTVCKTPIKGMCFLHKKFSSLPAQAIRCRLSNLLPAVQGQSWSREASDYFRELVNRRDTQIKINSIDWNEQSLSVFLADVTSSRAAIYINEALVKAGHAVIDSRLQKSVLSLPNFKPKVKNLHHFPSFLEIEMGFVPNIQEMAMLEDMHVPLHFILPLYFDVNVQAVEDPQTMYKKYEHAFLATVRSHPRGPNVWMNSRTTSKKKPFNVKFFGDLKDDILQFSEQCGLSVDENVEDELHEASDNLTIKTGERLANCYKNDLDLSETLISKLQNCGIDEYSQSQSESWNLAGSSEKSTIQGVSLKGPSGLDYDVNIFDNPEAFSNSDSNESKDITPESFLAKVYKLSKDLNAKDCADVIEPCSNLNPFRTELVVESDVREQRSSSITMDLSGSKSDKTTTIDSISDDGQISVSSGSSDYQPPPIFSNAETCISLARNMLPESKYHGLPSIPSYPYQQYIRWSNDSTSVLSPRFQNVPKWGPPPGFPPLIPMPLSPQYFRMPYFYGCNTMLPPFVPPPDDFYERYNAYLCNMRN